MTQRYQELVQEDLNVGTQAVWITAPHGGEVRSTQIGLHSVARGQKAWTTTWAPGAIAAGSYATTTIPVTDAAVGDFVMASYDKILTGDLRIMGNVMESGTAQVIIHNPTSAAITVASGTVGVLVFPAIEFDVTPAPTFTVTWTVEETEAGIVGESWNYYFTPVVVGGVAPYTYAWNFGDGEPDDPSETPTQVWLRGAYSNPDTISVTLTVTDDTMATAIFTDDVVVQFNE